AALLYSLAVSASCIYIGTIAGIRVTKGAEEMMIRPTTLCFVLITSFPLLQGSSRRLATPSAAETTRLASAYASLPLSFEANQGQAGKEVKFLSRGRGYCLFLTSTEAIVVLSKAEPPSQPAEYTGPSRQQAQQSAVMRMRLDEANPNPVLNGVDELPGKSNY